MTKFTLPLLFVLILLGNGLRSVVASTVFISEGSFASFLKISVDQTSAVIELLLGAVLLSLLITPRLINRYSERSLATVMCLVAGMASFGLAALFWINPPIAIREIFVIILFPLIGFSLASLAPLVQVMTNWGGERYAKLLTGVWAVAMPAAFLVTPQLVRVIAPRYGLDTYFAGFAILPFLLIPLILLVRPASVPPKEADAPEAQAQSLLPAILCLLGFEAATLMVTIYGITSYLTLIAGVIFVVTLVYFLIHRRSQTSSANLNVNRDVLRIFLFLFLINIATTGFYDTTYLVLHMCSNTLITDRATFGALAQVGAAMAATAILGKFALQRLLMFVGALITAIGVGSYLLYFGYPTAAVFIGSKAITGFGMGLLTTAAIFAVSHSAAKSAGLSLLIAFVIIIGTEAGLEIFEVFFQLSELSKISSDTAYMIIFWAQFALVIVAAPLIVQRSKPA